MRIGITVIILFVTIVLTLIPMPYTATAQLTPTTSTLYGATSFGPGAGFLPGSLYTLAPGTGVATLVGLLGEPWGDGGPAGLADGGCSAIDFHPITGILYGICFDFNIGESFLVTISPITGAITIVIGPLGTFTNTPGMSFHPTTGVLYATSFGPGFASQELVTVSTVTGLATPVSGASLGPVFFGGGNSIAFNAAGTLFFMSGGLTPNELYTVDYTGTGPGFEVLTSLPGGVVFPGVDGAHPLPFAAGPGGPFPALAGPRINAADFDPATGLLATIVNDGGPKYLSSTSPAGAGTAHIGSTTARMDAIAFEPILLVVGGEGIPIDTTALLIAGVQSSTIWMIPVLAFIGIAGLVIFKIKSKANQS